MQETEIRRTVAPVQSRQKVRPPPHLNRKELSIVVHICHPTKGRKSKIEVQFWHPWAKSKITRAKAYKA
jgi:hypothetical protein